VSSSSSGTEIKLWSQEASSARDACSTSLLTLMRSLFAEWNKPPIWTGSDSKSFPHPVIHLYT